MRNSGLNQGTGPLLKRLSVLLVATALLLSGLLTASSVFAAPKVKPPTTNTGKKPVKKLATLEYFIGLPESPSNIAKAETTETVEMTGTGTIVLKPKSATGGGGFVARDASGAITKTGTWEAVKLLSYQSYGPAKPSQGTYPRGSEGGRAQMRIKLLAEGEPVQYAVLRVTCKYGSPPPNTVDGIRLAVQDGLNYNKEISGSTLFVRK